MYGLIQTCVDQRAKPVSWTACDLYSFTVITFHRVSERRGNVWGHDSFYTHRVLTDPSLLTKSCTLWSFCLTRRSGKSSVSLSSLVCRLLWKSVVRPPLPPWLFSVLCFFLFFFNSVDSEGLLFSNCLNAVTQHFPLNAFSVQTDSPWLWSVRFPVAWRRQTVTHEI